MTKGCIQGSTCGPLLWNIILDELLELDLPSGCRIQAFADDVLLIAAAKDLPGLQAITNQALHAIVSWGRSVKLTFSPHKTQAIAFSNKARHALIHIDSHALHFQDDIKLLGVVLDRQLLFRKHVTHVIQKATNIFHKLTLYCRPTWGAHPENIRTIYLQVIQPIITYAAGIWGHVVRKKYICQKLLSMQRGFALRAIKGFRTVSTTAALALARFTPIDLKVLETNTIESARLSGHCTFVPDDIALERHVPPDLLLHPAHRITFSPRSFHSQADLSEHLNSLPLPIPTIYTDGSKLDDDSVGAAFVCYDGERPPVVKKFKLHPSCSVFQAELFALLQASRWASQHNFPQTLILSDSRAAIEASQNRSNTHPLVSSLHYTLHQHSPTGYIDFAWVKSHAGITGNELADEAAKKAATLHKAPDYCCYPISFVKHKAREVSLLKWRERYVNASQAQHTRDLLPTIDHIFTLFKHTHTTFTLTQILTGHAYNNAYLHRFKLTESDVCPCDRASSQTIEHLLQRCPNFAAHRFDHEQLCGHLGLSPYALVDLLENKSCVDSFARLSNSIIKVLKDFNAGL
ncbi:uncharacterized protein LOC123664180 [Melitaea cinxia]|uniref:uncharacterized protein LOC123664180 n=1 Tax=Melitaea cinxia TaxID=113334 RepID=UPI001E26F2F5|nr:uncharacterized protein LOC123664180 [Melitaea cinxia]